MIKHNASIYEPVNMNLCFTDQVIQVFLKEVDRKAGEMTMIQSVWHCSRMLLKLGIVNE